jgi:hypothetical protein
MVLEVWEDEQHADVHGGLFSAPLKMLLVRRVAIGDGSLIGRIGFRHSSLP